MLVASAKAVVKTFALSTGGIEETLRRSIGWWHMRSDQLIADESFLGAIGLGVFNDTAVALGVTGLPGPITDINDDVWALWFGFQGQSNILTAVGVVGDPQQGWRQDFDSRVMRKVDVGQTLVWIAEASTTGITLTGAVSHYATRR